MLEIVLKSNTKDTHVQKNEYILIAETVDHTLMLFYSLSNGSEVSRISRNDPQDSIPRSPQTMNMMSHYSSDCVLAYNTADLKREVIQVGLIYYMAP
jgi:hypothetical protein